MKELFELWFGLSILNMSEKKSNFFEKSAHNFLSFIKSFDQFGKPVGLTIKGESEFKTLYGGILSVGLQIYFIIILV